MANDEGESVRTSSVVIDHFEVAGPLIENMFAEANFTLDGYDAGNFELRLNSVVSGVLMCGLQRWGFTGRLASEPVDSFVTVLVTDGRMSMAPPGRPDVHVPVGGVWRSDTKEMTNSTWDRDFTFGSLHLPLMCIDEVAVLRGGGEAAHVQFFDNVPIDEATGRYWAELMRMAYREATAARSSLVSPLVRAHLVQMLAEAALSVFPNSIMTADYLPNTGHVGPITLRKAVAYMHAHVAQPITLADVAASAGIGVRALQNAFICHYDCSPMVYLRRIRLENVHRDLKAGDPRRGDTVNAIARRWGFGHPSHFTAAYRERYAILPSATLAS